MKRIIELEWLRCGQAKPYADSISQIRLTFKHYNGKGELEESDPIEQHVLKVLKAHENFIDSDLDNPYNKYMPKLTSFKKIGKGVWVAVIETRFVD